MKIVPKKQNKSFGNSPKPNKVHDIFTLSDKTKILGLVKDNMFLVKVGQFYRKK
jgi:hypothetical protein